ncbi:hypothetical protein ABPG77_000071 [Micractinium sp. CCAP 211/92]
MLFTPRLLRPVCRDSHGQILRTRSGTVHWPRAAPPSAVLGGNGGASGTPDGANLCRQLWSAFEVDSELARAECERKLAAEAESRKGEPSPKRDYFTSLAWAALLYPRSREEFRQAKAELDRLDEEGDRAIAEMHQRWEEASRRQANRKPSGSSSNRSAPPESPPPSGPWPAASVEDDPGAAHARAAAAEASAAAAVSWANAAVGHEAAAEAAAGHAGAAAAEWGRAAAAWHAAYDALGAARQAAPDAAAVREAAAAVEAARGLKSQLRSLQG